jgi:general secretion pathway protein I
VTMRGQRGAGFTLLEVMVAVAILALSLTAIFSSEAGAVKMAYRSRKMGVATLLARCKMGEIEEEIAKLGLPAVFDSGSDACCEDAPAEGFTCDWEVDLIVMPETMFLTDEEDKDPSAQKDKAAQGAQAAQNNPSGFGNAPGVPGALPPLPGAAATGTPPPGGANTATDPLSALNKPSAEEMLSGGALGGIATMAMSMVYPSLKPWFEAQIRRATVTVRWKEGSNEHSFDVTQYLVADPPAALSPEEAAKVNQGLQQQNGLGAPQAAPTAPAAPGAPP